jgi:hypothetical protein
MILTPADLAALTQRKQRAAQIRELRALGVPFRQRTDGSIVVFRKDLDEPPAQKRPPSPALRLPETRRVLSGAPSKVDAPRN